MNRVLPLGRYCLRFLSRENPEPVSRVLFLRKLSLGRDPLVPSYGGSRQSGRTLRHAVLRKALADDELGTWSMCPKTLDYLEREIQTRRPALILEFGSGISTLCLAQFMRDVHGGGDSVYVCSIEQA